MSGVVVVGGGVAGCMAALAARAQGADVELIKKAPGATAFCPGTMRLSAGPHDACEWHPFRRLALDAHEIDSQLDAAVAVFVETVASAGFDVQRLADEGTFLCTDGTVRRAELVPPTVAAGELSRLRSLRVGVIAIDAVGDYDAASVAATLRDENVSADVVAVEIELPRAAALTDLVGLQAPVVPRRRFDAVALPPGFTALPEGAFELVAYGTSAHGWELQLALWRALEMRGVAVRTDEVVRLEADGEEVGAARTRGGGAIEADSFVLAGGRFLGGGLRKHRTTREPLLDLGVFHEGRPLKAAWRGLRHLEYLASDPAFAEGLLTDDQLRPFDHHGEVAYRNVRAAGGILGGWDHAAGGGFGVPILTGWLAGTWARAQ